jgi:hypothetical protein
VTINTWCTAADVATFTGQTVANEDVTAAQTIIEGHIRRVWRSTDATGHDYYWLQRAVAWQAVYLAQHPEALSMMNVQSVSQDGMSFSIPQGAKLYIAPLAIAMLNNLFRGSNTTIRLNSAFQKNRVRQGQVPGGTMPWRRME